MESSISRFKAKKMKRQTLASEHAEPQSFLIFARVWWLGRGQWLFLPFFLLGMHCNWSSCNLCTSFSQCSVSIWLCNSRHKSSEKFLPLCWRSPCACKPALFCAQHIASSSNDLHDMQNFSKVIALHKSDLDFLRHTSLLNLQPSVLLRALYKSPCVSSQQCRWQMCHRLFLIFLTYAYSHSSFVSCRVPIHFKLDEINPI